MATTELRLELGTGVAGRGLCGAVWHYIIIIHPSSMGVRLYYSVIVGVVYTIVL